jgi:hypothetical protein
LLIGTFCETEHVAVDAKGAHNWPDFFVAFSLDDHALSTDNSLVSGTSSRGAVVTVSAFDLKASI